MDNSEFKQGANQDNLNHANTYEDLSRIRPARLKTEYEDADTDSTNQDYVDASVREAKVQFTPRHDYIGDSSKRKIEAEDEDEVLAASEDVYINPDSQSVLMEILDWVRYILIAVILGLVISRFVLQRSFVVGRSMEPTLHNEDQLLVNKIGRYFSEFENGEIVTVNTSTMGDLANDLPVDDELIVKRIVAIPGDSIDFVDGTVVLNGEVLIEDYLDAGTYTQAPTSWVGPLTIPEDYYYVLGDKRENSADSRIIGPVHKDSIEGEVWIRIYPLSDFGPVD